MRTSQLEYFLSVAEHLSFTKASEQCHVAQPAISQQIQALEKELGFPLFQRSTKGVSLTDAGTQYYRDISGVVRSLERADKRASAIAHGESGLIGIGVASSGQASMLKMISQFYDRYPEIRIELHRVTSKDQYDQLKQGMCDIFPTGLSYFHGKGDVLFAKILASPLRILVSKHHPLATKPHLTVQDLLTYPHIMAACSTPEPLIETYPHLTDHDDTTVLFAEDQGIAWMMMTLGFGIEAVPESIISSMDNRDCTVLAVEGYDAVLHMGWAYLSSNENPALQKFLDYLNDKGL